MENLNIQVLAENYPGVGNVALGYRVDGTLFNLSEFKDVVKRLNNQGYYYKNKEFVYSNYPYKIAQVYKGDQPLQNIYPVDNQLSDDLYNKLAEHALSTEELGISADLMVFREQEDVVIPQEPVNGSRDVLWEDDLNSVFTQDEIRRFGDLTELEEEAVENIYEEYKSRKAYNKLVTEITYKLPEELNQYEEVYRSSYISITASGTDEEIKETKHVSALRSVIKSMLEIPRTKAITDRKKKADEEYTLLNLEPILSKLIPTESGKTSWLTFTTSIFSSVQESIMDDIVNLYGSSEAFIDEFVKFKHGDAVLHPIQTTIGNKNETIYVVKYVSQDRGIKIDFVREQFGKDIRVPYALIQLCYALNGTTDIIQELNLLQELYFLDLGIKVNINEMMFEESSCEVLNLTYLGKYDDAKDVHMFKDSDNKYMLIVDDHIGNKLLGTKYILNGSNFKIKYNGKRLAIRPLGEVLSSDQILELHQEVASVYDASGNQSTIIEPYAGYNDYIYKEDSEGITNMIHLHLINNYDKLIEENKQFMNNLDNGLQAPPVSNITPQVTTPIQEVVNHVPEVEIPTMEEGIADIFANQPVQPSYDDGIDIKIPSYDDGIDIKIPSYDDGIDIKIPSVQSVEITPDANPYAPPTDVPQNIAQAYFMMMGSMDQNKLGLFKTEFTNLINKYLV